MKRLVLCLMFVGLAPAVLAGVVFPKACSGVSDVGQQWQITDKKRQLYLMTNTSKNALWLTHRAKKAGAQAGWSSQLKPGMWSALIMDRKGFAFDCTESMPGHEQRVACQAILAVCRQKAQLSKTDKGAFWVEENKSLAELISASEQRGVEFIKD